MTMVSFPYMMIKMVSDLDWSKVNKIKGFPENVDKSTSTQGKGEYSREGSQSGHGNIKEDKSKVGRVVESKEVSN